MASRAQRKIMQTRNILILVIVVCAAKLIKTLKDGGGETAQIAILIIVIAVLGVILGLYMWLDRYTKKEQASYGQPKGDIVDEPVVTERAGGLKGICREIFKNDGE